LDVKWNEAETLAFSTFKTPNQLAEAITSPKLRDQALIAMRDIRHVNSHYRDWLGTKQYLEDRRPSIIFIGHQETLTTDFSTLCGYLGINASLPTDTILSHATPERFDKSLSPEGVANIKAWFRDDYDLLDFAADYFDSHGLGKTVAG
jgi:hypothetical protein